MYHLFSSVGFLHRSEVGRETHAINSRGRTLSNTHKHSHTLSHSAGHSVETRKHHQSANTQTIILSHIHVQSAWRQRAVCAAAVLHLTHLLSRHVNAHLNTRPECLSSLCAEAKETFDRTIVLTCAT